MTTLDLALLTATLLLTLTTALTLLLISRTLVRADAPVEGEGGERWLDEATARTAEGS